MTTERKKIEKLIYETFNALDPTGTNTDHYKKILSTMSDADFKKFMSRPFPFKFHHKPFEIEPSMEQISNAADIIGVPLMEVVNMPYLYENENGEPVQTKECLVGYLPIKKMKQFATKKNSMSTNISDRDMKTGLLIGDDKNGKTTDREMESLVVMGFENTMKEFSRHRADSMDAKNNMYNTINIKGDVSLEEVPVDIDDSISKNLMNTYLIGSLLNSNIINQDYYLPKTIKDRKKKIERET